MTENELREKYVGVMKAWLGRNKADGSHRGIIDCYNSIRPLPRKYMVTYKDAWCAATVSAAAHSADMLDIIPAECSCNMMIGLSQKMGRWEERDGYEPSPGDIIFYDWQGKPGECKGPSEHVGVVEKIQGNDIVVIEGNRHEKVDRRNAPINWQYIRGFHLPDYQGKALKISADTLAKAKIISNPEYWVETAKRGKVRWLPELIGKMANYVDGR